MKVARGMEWHSQAIAGEMLDAVTDGPYIQGSTIRICAPLPSYLSASIVEDV